MNQEVGIQAKTISCFRVDGRALGLYERSKTSEARPGPIFFDNLA